MLYADRLALDVIERHFGQIVRLVSHMLTIHGGLTLPELIASVSDQDILSIRTTSTEIRNSLIVLLTHGLVNATSQPIPVADVGSKNRQTSQETKFSPPRYIFDRDAAIRRLRFPKYIRYAHDHFGLEGELISYALLCHTQLSFTECKDFLMDLNDEIPKQVTTESLEKAWDAMAEDRVITRAVGLDLPSQLLAGDQGALMSRRSLAFARQSTNNVTNGRSRKAIRSPLESLTGASVKRRKVSATAPRGLNGAAAVLSNASTHLTQPIQALGQTGTNGIDADSNLEDDQANFQPINNVNDRNTQLWRFSHERVHEKLLHLALTRFVAEKLGNTAKTIIEAALSLLPHEFSASNNRKESMKRNEDTLLEKEDEHGTELVEEYQRKSTPFSAQAVFEIVSKDTQNDKEPKIAWQQLLTNLKLLASPEMDVLIHLRDGADGGQFQVHFSNVVSSLRYRTIGAITEQRYGAHAARIVRMLRDKGMLEDKQISTIALLSPKDTRSVLYTLLRARFIRQQEIAKRANYDPNTMIYCWHVDDKGLTETMLTILYHSMYNLCARRSKELQRHESLLVQEKTAANAAGHDAALAKITSAIDKLDAALMHTDDTLILFSSW